LWPAGIAAILAATALLVKRKAPRAEVAAGPANSAGGSDPVVGPRAAASSIIGLLLILVVGAVAVYALISLLGLLVVHTGPSIDKPIYTWMTHHRVHTWKAVMDRLTKVGNTWTTWGAAVAAAVVLAAFYRAHKWLPPVALGAAIVIDHYLTLAVRHTFERPGPPDSPGGTFPSGGCDRIIVFYGLIAFLIWREISGNKRVALWSGGVVAALAFSEGYSRGYLTLHWFTDIISGLIYGTLILAVFIATIRLVNGPGRSAEVAAVSGGTEPLRETSPAGAPLTAAESGGSVARSVP
jgi:membrane-associated phospholipid phosphatase